MTIAADIKLQSGDRLSTSAVLGLNGPKADDWARLRQLQYGELGDFGVRRLIFHMVAVIITMWMLADAVSTMLLCGWALMIAAALYSNSDIERSWGEQKGRQIRPRDLVRHSLMVFVLASAWAMALIATAWWGDLVLLLSLIGVVSILALGSAVALMAPPLGTVIYVGTTATGGSIALIMADRIDLAPMPFLFAYVAISGAIEKSRTLLTARIAQAGMQENAQVVSLLLREHEESSADWLWEVDTRRRLRSVSPRFAYALGKGVEEVEGERFLNIIAGRNWSEEAVHHSLHDLAERLKRGENFSALIVRVEINGRQRWWELSGAPMFDSDRRYIGFRGVGSDVTEKRESSEKIAFLARYDTLTNLPNRLQLHEKLAEALRYSAQWRTRCAFVMLDLDRFKAVNDTLGHLIGDRLLAEVAHRLNAICGEGGICGRLGGDEFGIVIHDLRDGAMLDNLAKRIIESLTEPFNIDGHALYIGTSVGSAIGPRDGDTVEELMRNADLALYEAKGQGGGEHCRYEPTLHAAAEEQRRIEVALRSAVERGELTLQYQPVVDSHSEKVVSFEALVRWNSPEHGFVSPAKFIPIAEDTRLIISIGEWVLRRACEQAVAWPTHTMINVNVSPAQLLQPNFVDLVQQVLTETGLPARRLEIEVTESVFLADATTAKTALEAIIGLGCSVALDDFGTGYSSLGYLRTLRFSTIKVDRLFVKGASQGNRESLAIINAVVAMSDSLGMTTTAEGVETSDEARLIRSLGCTKIQGYHFGRPMPAADATKLLEAARSKAFDAAAFAKRTMEGHRG